MINRKREKVSRNTVSREALLLHLKQARKPETLEEIHRRVSKKMPSLAFSTVYRIIRSFEEQGIVDRVDWRDRGSRYEIVGPHHHHLVCESCGAMKDIEDNDISLNLKKIAAQTGFVLKDHIIELTGLCENCYKE